MRPLFGVEGRAAVATLMARRRVLLAFDFDGTLAPTVVRPHAARVPLAVTRRLAPLCELRPVAVVTGRAVADVSARLGFAPRFVIGNHGIEDPQGQLPQAGSACLEPLRQCLRACAAQLCAAGVGVEDKGLSIALHYRLAPEPARALQVIEQVLGDSPATLQRSVGKSVVNLLPVGAPDKGDALQSLVQRCGATAGFFIGDGCNDVPAFEKLSEAWLTVRMGPDPGPSLARYFIDGPAQLPTLLQTMLDAARSARVS